MQWPAWNVLLVDGKMIEFHAAMAPSDVKKHLFNKAKLSGAAKWKKKVELRKCTMTSGR